MEKLTGIELTKVLKGLEERDDLTFEVEVEEDVATETEATGSINFMNVGWKYELKDNFLHLQLDDAEVYWDGVMGTSPEEIKAYEEEAQATMEGLTEIATIVTIA